MTQVQANQVDEQDGQSELHGLLGEYANVDDVLAAARRVRDAGYQYFDVHSPFPVHGIDEAMGLRPTILPWIVLLCGLAGMGTGLGLTVYTMAYDYPFYVSGKPLVSLPAFIPIIFELTILLSAFGAVFGMLLLNKLPTLYNPLLTHPAFARVTDDRFFVAIEGRDERFDEKQTLELLKATKAMEVHRVEVPVEE